MSQGQVSIRETGDSQHLSSQLFQYSFVSSHLLCVSNKMTELFSKYEQAQYSSMLHTLKERPEPMSNLHRPSTLDSHSSSPVGMGGFQSSHGNMYTSEQFSHLSMFEDSRDHLSSSADHSLSSSSQTNSGDSWYIRPASKSNADLLHSEGNNSVQRLGNPHNDAHHVSASSLPSHGLMLPLQ